MLFDTHCHLDAPDFDRDREAVWSRALDANVRRAVIPAVEPARWDITLGCARDGERYAALGIHPHYLSRLEDATIDAAMSGLESRMRGARGRVVAIGECGFDASTEALRATLARQRRVFFAHAEVARALGLPLVLHVFKAHAEALAAMRAVTLPDPPGVIHSFSGGADLAREYLSLGFHLAMGGAVTRARARRPLEALCVIPAGRLLLETDAPDQTPTGVEEGIRRCEPCHLVLIAQRVAELRGESLESLAEATTANACALFAL